MGKRKGYDFEREIDEGFKVAGLEHAYDYFKIPDGKNLGRMINLPVPCDFVAFTPKTQHFIEAKQTSLPRFPFKNIKEHQLRTLMTVEYSPDSLGYFLIQFSKKKERNKTFVVLGSQITKWGDTYKASVPIKEFEDNCHELKRLTAKHHPNKKCAFIELSLQKIEKWLK